LVGLFYPDYVNVTNQVNVQKHYNLLKKNTLILRLTKSCSYESFHVFIYKVHSSI